MTLQGEADSLSYALLMWHPKVGGTVIFYPTGKLIDAESVEVQEVIDDDTIKIRWFDRTKEEWLLITTKRASHPRPPTSWDFVV